MSVPACDSERYLHTFLRDAHKVAFLLQWAVLCSFVSQKKLLFLFRQQAWPNFYTHVLLRDSCSRIALRLSALRITAPERALRNLPWFQIRWEPIFFFSCDFGAIPDFTSRCPTCLMRPRVTGVRNSKHCSEDCKFHMMCLTFCNFFFINFFFFFF